MPSRRAVVPRSIRVRLTALAVAVVVAVLVVAAVALAAAQRRVLTHDLDAALAAYSAELGEVAFPAGTVTTLDPRLDDEAVTQVVDLGGAVVASTANYAGRGPLPAPGEGVAQRWRTTRLLDGAARFRLLSRRSGNVVVHTAAPLDDVDDAVASLWVGFAVAVPAVVGVLGALVYWLVGRSLRPVEAMRREVADISGNDLRRRVPEPRTGDEVERLAHTMNAMLDRVAEAVERQQRFVADASHELRSPLTRMRSELEVDLGHPSTADFAATHRSVLEEAGNLERLVDDLLALARLDAGVGRRAPEPVDLDDVVLREARRRREGGGARIDLGGVSAAQVLGHPDELARVVRNLLDNAARHAGAVVTVELGEHDGTARLVVTDDGPGIPPAERERVFERFARLDEARARAAGGTGLGLAIVREVVERHGGTVRAEPGRGQGARMVVELPAHPGGPHPT